jgi:hypothetical protein
MTERFISSPEIALGFSAPKKCGEITAVKNAQHSGSALNRKALWFILSDFRS